MEKFIADFHVHSHFSVATSPLLVPEHLDLWARLKGVKVIGTGDFTHPGWLQELREKLEPAEPGLYELKKELRLPPPFHAPWFSQTETRFMLTGEVSSIYKRDGRVRKVHNLIFAPDFAAVENIQQRLAGLRANISSDGRPILGMDSRDLLELVLEATAGRAFFVPAHIWTPWFSVLGDKSGFESITACFADLAGHIRSVETGLSSDPAMNWLCSFLDPYRLISNSDAHSPEKIGREANLFATELSYPAMIGALAEDGEGFCGTIEFFPQEGKYHFDGHRKCGVRWHPEQTRAHHGICPACGRPVVVGVMNRVMQLADRKSGDERPGRRPFFSLIPLREILAEILDTKPEAGKIGHLYRRLVKALGPELIIELEAPLPEIRAVAGDELAEGIARMREHRVHISEGYDGEYGRIRVFADGEISRLGGQQALFAGLLEGKEEKGDGAAAPSIPAQERPRKTAAGEEKNAAAAAAGPDAEQEAAMGHGPGPALVIAGPGTGKTRVLTGRIARLLDAGAAAPDEILAITFTNKAAREMRERLALLRPGDSGRPGVSVSTFHAFGLSLLGAHGQALKRSPGFSIVDEENRQLLLKAHAIGAARRIAWLADHISLCKQRGSDPEEVADAELRQGYRQYENLLLKLDAFDLDDLIAAPCRLLAENPEVAEKIRRTYRHVLVDECQDMNESQYRLLKLLWPPGGEANLFLVGDPDQAIYGFRGADPGLIRRFAAEYAPVAEYRLKRSYRCSDTILGASAGVLAEKGEIRVAGLQPGVKVRISANPTDRSEAEFVARTIEELMGGVRFFSIDSDVTGGAEEAGSGGFGDFAVLCRTGEQFAVLQEALQQHGIPWQKAEERPFFRRDPGRMVLDLLRHSLRPASAFSQAILLERDLAGSGAPDVLRELVQALAERPQVSAKLEFLAATFPMREPEAASDMERLIRLAEPYGERSEDFLQDMALNKGSDALRPGLECVSLLTLHAAKGLEFATVFVTGCEAGLIPYSLFPGQEAAVPEEKRLLYVGMTRAARRLYLTHAGRRRLFGRTWTLPRSPFLDGIERELLEESRHEPRRDGGPKQRKLFDI